MAKCEIKGDKGERGAQGEGTERRGNRADDADTRGRNLWIRNRGGISD